MTREEICEAMDWHYNSADHSNDGLLARIDMAINGAVAAEREECAKVCDDYSADKLALYKGFRPYNGHEVGRADPFVDGQSSGSEDCAEAIRARNT